MGAASGRVMQNSALSSLPSLRDTGKKRLGESNRKKVGMLFLVTLALAAAAPVELVEYAPKKTTRHVLKSLDYHLSFEQYVAEYRKVYTDAEKPARQAAFEASLAAIKAHNEQIPAPAVFQMSLRISY